MNQPLKILHLEDNPNDTELVQVALQNEGIACRMVRVETKADFLVALENEDFDLIFSDNSLPSFDGHSALKTARQKRPEIPFIFISGTLGEEVAIETLRDGATDYVLKQRLSRLVPAVRRAMREIEERSARRKAEELLKVSNGLRLVGQMAASIIHDFRSPMQIIQGSAEILELPNVPAEKKARQGRIIREQIRRMANMTQDLLDFARGETRLDKAPLAAGDMLAEVNFFMEEYCKGSPVKFQSVLKKPFQFVADREKIIRVLINLARNAKEAMPYGGEITLAAVQKGMEVFFQVSDNGPGIPPEIRERLFQPFATFGKSGGTGLGLALSRKIVGDHGGTIECVSEPGKGASFIVSLPVGSAELSKPAATPKAPGAKSRAR